MIKYKESKKISDKDLRPLYESISWHYAGKYSDLSVILENSYLVYSAWDGDRLVGLVRTVGDGLSIQYVQDILILPEYKKLGIGKELLRYALEKSEHIRQFALITGSSEENRYVLDWYEKQGLRPFEKDEIKGFWRVKI